MAAKPQDISRFKRASTLPKLRGAPGSPDLSNLSPLHPPSKQTVNVPPMKLPRALGALNEETCLSPTGRDAAGVLALLRGGQESGARAKRRISTDELEDLDDDDDDKSKKLRGSRCGTCDHCLKPDCGTCTNCKDKPKFGGPGIKKQACSERKCLKPNIRGNRVKQLKTSTNGTNPRVDGEQDDHDMLED